MKQDSMRNGRKREISYYLYMLKAEAKFLIGMKHVDCGILYKPAYDFHFFAVTLLRLIGSDFIVVLVLAEHYDKRI